MLVLKACKLNMHAAAEEGSYTKPCLSCDAEGGTGCPVLPCPTFLRHNISSKVLVVRQEVILFQSMSIHLAIGMSVSIGEPVKALTDARISRALDPTYVKAWYREVSCNHFVISNK
jgi:hypothetical protein